MTSDWCFEIAIVSLLTNTSNKLICRINYFSIVDRVILHSQLDIIIESMMHVLRWQWKQDVSSHKLEQFLWHRIISLHRFQTEWETGLNSCNLFIWNSPKIKLFVYQISTFGKYIVRVEGDALAFQDITIRCSWNAMCITFVQLAENWLKIIMIE